MVRSIIKKTEWTKEEDEQLIVKMFPYQWKIMVPFLGSSAHMCIEHFQELLDKEENRQVDLLLVHCFLVGIEYLVYFFVFVSHTVLYLVFLLFKSCLSYYYCLVDIQINLYLLFYLDL